MLRFTRAVSSWRMKASSWLSLLSARQLMWDSSPSSSMKASSERSRLLSRTSISSISVSLTLSDSAISPNSGFFDAMLCSFFLAWLSLKKSLRWAWVVPIFTRLQVLMM